MMNATKEMRNQFVVSLLPAKERFIYDSAIEKKPVQFCFFFGHESTVEHAIFFLGRQLCSHRPHASSASIVSYQQQ
jgi:hypothetical protein